MVRFRFGNEAERVAFFKTKADQHLAVSPIYIYIYYIYLRYSNGIYCFLVVIIHMLFVFFPIVMIFVIVYCY